MVPNLAVIVITQKSEVQVTLSNINKDHLQGSPKNDKEGNNDY